jgi:predicted PurR-regulated permease PerM
MIYAVCNFFQPPVFAGMTEKVAHHIYLGTAMKFKNKLTMMTLTLIIFVLIASTAVSVITTREQNAEESFNLLEKTFALIHMELADIQNRILDTVRQSSQAANLAGNIKSFMYYKSKPTRSYIQDEYKKMIGHLFGVASAHHISQLAVYDISADLMAILHFEDDKTLFGIPYRLPDKLVYELGTLKPGDKIENLSWKIADSLPFINHLASKEISGDETVCFKQTQDALAIVLSIPVSGEKQAGAVKISRNLDEAFANRISKISGTDVNIFSKSSFSAGTLPAYKSFDADSIRNQNKFSVNDKDIFSDTVDIEGRRYDQGIQLFENKSDLAGAAAVFTSRAQSHTREFVILMGIAALGCIILAIPAAMFFAKSVTGSISRIVPELDDGSNRLAAASKQLSASSQSQAEKSSEQASMLEEIASALDEISSTTGQNAQNAGNVKVSMDKVYQLIEEANKSVAEQTNSMKKSLDASEEMSRIVKTIDEIAFQTNLLALNAAVEAARAGEAGAGFAVVADEVRNLAKRCAEAVKDTSGLIDSSAALIKNGSVSVEKTADIFAEITRNTQNAVRLVSTISEESGKQADSIAAITKSVEEISTITQNSAASAEKLATVSDNFKYLAENMKDAVKALFPLVYGRR